MNTTTFKSPFILAITLLSVRLASFAAGVVTTPDESSLGAALTGGGTVTLACDGTILLSGTLVIANNTLIDGNGHSISISGNGSVRVFQVNNGVQLTLQNLTVANGSSNQGGGLYSDGATVTCSNVVFQSNQARGSNGISSTSPTSGGSAYGGGIYNNTGSLTLIDCLFTANLATGGTGGFYSGVGPVMGPGAAAGHGSGGAIFTSGNLYLTNCTFSSNQSAGGTGGNAGPGGGTGGQGGSAYGGAIVNQGGSIVGSNCILTQNTATGGTTPGLRAQTPYRGLAEGGAVCNLGGTVNLTGGSFTLNSILGSPASGGAIFHATGALLLSSATIISNTATGDASTIYYGSTGSTGSGGGLYNGATATVTDCLISSNKVSGGLGVTLNSVIGGGGAGNGAGVCNAGALDLLGCTLAGNTATGGQGGQGAPGGPGGTASGGGVFNSGNSAHLINCTLVGNRVVGGPGAEWSGAGGSSSGGGIYNINSNANAVGVTNCTLSGNQALAGTPGSSGAAGTALGGSISRGAGGIQLVNTIVAGGISANASGTLTDLGHNISSDASCAFSAPGSLNNTNPKLGVFGNYGGPTPTLPLLVGSPAMDAANNAAAPATDQRGITRPRGSSSDIGAFELVTIILSQPQAQTAIAGSPASLTVGLQGSSLASFQWTFNGTNLPGATDNPLVFPIALPEHSGIYAVTVSNEVGITTSSNANLTVLPYLITVQPQSHSVYAGTDSSFSIGIQAADPKTFQWKFNGTDLPGATSSTLNLPNVSPTDAGTYSVVVSNAYGVATSSNVVLTVLFTAGQAVGEPGLTWQGGGNLDWFVETNITHDGVMALQSGPIAGNQQSAISTTVTGPGTVIFWWKVSSEDSSDYLRFFIGSTAMVKISGEVDWQQKSFAIPAGSQTLRWVYQKDVDVSSGLDAAWLDQVHFVNDRLDSILWQNAKGFQFRNGMQPGTYIIQASTNLADWMPVSTNIISLGGNVPVFTDSTSTNLPYRFYRAQQQ